MVTNPMIDSSAPGFAMRYFSQTDSEFDSDFHVEILGRKSAERQILFGKERRKIFVFPNPRDEISSAFFLFIFLQFVSSSVSDY